MIRELLKDVDQTTRREAFILLLAGILLSGIILFLDIRAAHFPEGYYLSRPDAREGSAMQEDLTVKAKGEDKNAFSISLDVDPREYTETEKSEILESQADSLLPLILNGNVSEDHIQGDLSLVREIPNLPIRVSWSYSDEFADFISYSGAINPEMLEQLPDEGMPFVLKATLIWEDKSRMSTSRTLVFHAEKPFLTGKALLEKQIRDALRIADDSSRTEEKQPLPTEAGSYSLTWKKKADSRGFTLLILTFAGSIGLILAKKKSLEDAKKKHIRELELDYPEVVSKLRLYMEAGLPCRGGWFQICDEYHRQLDAGQTERRPLYEEMCLVCREMQSGVSESAAYEHFGARCRIPACRKLATLLSQNTSRGNAGLADLLDKEMWQAFEDRKAAALRKGEEAGTKLLAPMIGMMGIVMIIVIAPAFFAMNI